MGGERRFVAGLGRFFGTAPGLQVGIGDDAAVVRTRDATVVCCDPVVEGVHFTASTPKHLVGRKVVNRNLADLAAMGAVPDWLLVSVVFPKGFPSRHRRQLFAGLRAAARAASAVVVGGDVATTAGPLVVTVTALGHLPGRPLRRDGGRVGDTVHVSGALGGSRLGHHLRFAPPLACGVWLARQRRVSAAMDVSDGLLLDLETLRRASGVPGAELFAAAVPIAHAARRLARGKPAAALHHALTDGEDHVLLWTQRPGELPAGGPLAESRRAPIGRLVDRPGLWLVHADGRRERLAAVGFEHDLQGDGLASRRRRRREQA